MILDRRALLTGAAALGAVALLPPGLLYAQAAATETVDLPVGKRITKLSIWRPTGPAKGVLLFSTGQGSWPERYEAMLRALVAEGYAVFAPLHVDSMHYPDRDNFTAQQGFFERVADMRATSAVAIAAYPGLPVAAVGHSYGSLIALGMGGALANLMPLRNPAVSAVLAFSSPGLIPGLVGPGAYASLAVPAMLITGTKDLVEGFVSDPADHLVPIETSPAGDKYALVVAGAGHRLVAESGTPEFERAQLWARSFLAAYVPSDGRAKARLAALPVKPGDRYIVRKADK